MKPKIPKKIVKQIININERENNMFDRAVELGTHNINYFLPNKTMDDRSNQDGGV